MTTMLDMADPQAGLPEFLRRRQPTYAQMPQGLLSQQAYQAAGPFPQYQPKPMNIAPPLPPAPVQPGQSGSDGGGGAAGLGGLLGAALQNPQGLSSLASGAQNLFGGGGVEGLANLGSLSSLSSAAGIGAAGQPGLLSLGSLGGLSSTGVGSGSIASQAGGMGAALQAGAGAAPAGTAAAGSGGLGTLGTIGAGLGLAAGAAGAYEGIRTGNEGMAALGGGVAGVSGGLLAGLQGMAALGPVGLAAAGVTALAASMVNTAEFGDVALRNYWSGIDSGRNIGESDPVELAQGFINFYRTNKNNFPGQAVYGRTGNEDFMFDMTQQVNQAVQSGQVPPDATPGQIYEGVVKPWLDTMGGGTPDERTRAVQDFMMTDLIASYQQGKPISNAQVKGDTKFRIVSERPVYPGQASAQPAPMEPQPDLNMMGLLGGMY